MIMTTESGVGDCENGAIQTGVGMFRISLSRCTQSTNSGVGVLEDKVSIWQEFDMFRIFVFIVWTTFVKHMSLKNVIFPVKMPPVHGVLSWSLRRPGVILTRFWMFRTKFSGWVVGGGTVNIASAPGPGPLCLNWNKWEWLRMNQQWTRNGT